MATNFRNNVTKNIGTIVQFTQHHHTQQLFNSGWISSANLTESVVKASVTLTATPDSVTGFIVKDVLIVPT